MIGRASATLALVLLSACSGAPVAPRADGEARATAAEPREPAADPSYYGGGARISARHYRLRTRLDVPAAAAFAVLTDRARQRLGALLAGSERIVDAYSLADRLLISLSANHPGGPIEILISDDRDRMFVFNERRKWAAALPRERLPDVLDATRGSSERQDFTGTIEPKAVPPDSSSSRTVRGISANIGLRYRPPGRRANAWSLRLQLQAAGPDELERFPFQHPLYHLALPLLQDYRGRLVLETLTYTGPVPSGWRLSVTNETLGTAPLSRQTRVVDRGWIRLPAHRFAARRAGYRYSSGLWRPEAAGRQLQPKDRLSGLRPGGKLATLEVSNQAARAALVYLDGALVAWVAPGRDLTVKGLTEGFYRLYAVSPSGVRAWGPRDTYVPGPLVLH